MAAALQNFRTCPVLCRLKLGDRCAFPSVAALKCEVQTLRRSFRHCLIPVQNSVSSKSTVRLGTNGARKVKFPKAAIKDSQSKFELHKIQSVNRDDGTCNTDCVTVATESNRAGDGAQKSGPSHQIEPSVNKPSWSAKELFSGRSLVLGGSVAAVLLLTVFRREVAPVFRWIITQMNSLTDKSVIGQASIESTATLLAVFLTLYWSFFEYRRTRELEAMEIELSQRAQSLQDLELQLREELDKLTQRLDSAAIEIEQLKHVHTDIIAVNERIAAIEEDFNSCKNTE